MLTLTRDQINDFLHTGHAIPVSKGLRREWMNANAPEWGDGELKGALQAAGAIEQTDAHFSGWQACVDEVTLVH